MSKESNKNYISRGFGFTNAYVVPFAIGVSIAYLISVMMASSASSGYNFVYDASQSTDIVQGDRVSYASVVLEENAFDVEIGVPVAIEADTTVAKPSSSYSLVGLIYNPDSSFAFIKSGGDVFLVSSASGSEDSPCVIREADNMSVTLDCDGKTEHLTLASNDRKGGAYAKVPSTGFVNIPSSAVSKVVGGSPVPSSGAKISPTSGGVNVEVSRSYVDSQLADVNKIFTTTRIAPKYQGDDFLGYGILGFSADSPLKAIGIQKGDIIVRINGESTDNPTALYGLVGDADSIDSLTIEVLRAGAKQTIFVSVKD